MQYCLHCLYSQFLFEKNIIYMIYYTKQHYVLITLDPASQTMLLQVITRCWCNKTRLKFANCLFCCGPKSQRYYSTTGKIRSTSKHYSISEHLFIVHNIFNIHTSSSIVGWLSKPKNGNSIKFATKSIGRNNCLKNRKRAIRAINFSQTCLDFITGVYIILYPFISQRL